MSNTDKLLYIDGLGEITQNLNIGGNINLTETLFTKKLGIGTNNPQYDLDINGTLGITGTLSTPTIRPTNFAQNTWNPVIKLTEANANNIAFHIATHYALDTEKHYWGLLNNTNSNALIHVSQDGNIVIQGDLRVTNTLTVDSATTLRTLDISHTTESTSKDTGALIVNGGIGIAKNINIGGNLNIDKINGYTDSNNIEIGAYIDITGQTFKADIINASQYSYNGTPMIAGNRQANFTALEIKHSTNNDTKCSINNGDNGTLEIDTINEITTNAGVTIEGVLLKDNNLNVDIVNASQYSYNGTPMIAGNRQANFTALEIKHSTNNDTKCSINNGDNGTLGIDTINEITTNAGVTIEGVLLKDNNLNVDTIQEKTTNTGVTIDSVLLKDGNITGNITGELIGNADTASAIKNLNYDNGKYLKSTSNGYTWDTPSGGGNSLVRTATGVPLQVWEPVVFWKSDLSRNIGSTAYNGNNDKRAIMWAIESNPNSFRALGLFANNNNSYEYTTYSHWSRVGWFNTSTDESNFSFTASHRCYSNNNNLYNDDKIGLIVQSTGNYDNINNNNNIDVDNAIPTVELTNTSKSKKVLGVIAKYEKDEEQRQGMDFGYIACYEKDKNRLYINGIGEGAIWVCNSNGNLENGDYIQSSNIAGYGEKQNSEFLANYTVAKITMDVDFNNIPTGFETRTLDNNITAVFVGCIYYCG